MLKFCSSKYLSSQEVNYKTKIKWKKSLYLSSTPSGFKLNYLNLKIWKYFIIQSDSEVCFESKIISLLKITEKLTLLTLIHENTPTPP